LNATSDPGRLFADKHRSYVRFVRSVLYPQGIRAFFLKSPLLRNGLRVIDAGCGTGIVTLALHDALARRGLTPAAMHAFDLTPAMLESFHRSIQMRQIAGISTARCDVLQLDALPTSWNNYDLVVSASMLEYLPRDRFVAALAALRAILNAKGTFLLFITRRNWLTRPLIGRWWQSNLYNSAEIHESLRQAGYANIEFRTFPWPFRHLAAWGYIVEASG
jgi:ubiquinone/menaquinone biosynthesis C-methylase UbiE